MRRPRVCAKAARLREGVGVIWIIIAAIILLTVVAPFIVPRTVTKKLPEPEELADKDSRFIAINSVSIHYKDFPPANGGSRATFVLLHGFGSSTYTWRHVIPTLRNFGRVIVYDRPGAGLSGRPVGNSLEQYNPYTPDAQIELTTQLMDGLHVDKAIIAAHSTGGPLAVETAYRHAERVLALILISPSLFGGMAMPGLVRPLLRLPQLSHLGPAALRLFFAPDRFVTRLLKMTWHDASRIDPASIVEYDRTSRVRDWDRSLWEMTVVSGQTEAIRHIRRLELPILVVAGDDDRVLPLSDQEHLIEEVPGSRLVVVANAGHNPQEEQPEETASLVEGFLKDRVAEFFSA